VRLGPVRVTSPVLTTAVCTAPLEYFIEKRVNKSFALFVKPMVIIIANPKMIGELRKKRRKKK